MFEFFALPEKVRTFLFELLGALLFIALLWGTFELIQHKNEQIKTLNTSLTTQTDKNKELTKTVENKNKSENVTEVVAEAGKKKEEVREVAKEKVVIQVDKKVEEIKKKYEELPPTPTNETTKVAEISTERIQGLWIIYCQEVTDDPACPTKE